MKRLFRFKKLSTKITFIIGLIILIVAGGVAVYMQTRIIEEIQNGADNYLKYQAVKLAGDFDVVYFNATASGIELPIDQIEDLMNKTKEHIKGLVLLQDSQGSFIDVGDSIRQIGVNEANKVALVIAGKLYETIPVTIKEEGYIVVASHLANGHTIYIASLVSEVNREIVASLTRFAIIFVVAYTIVLIIAYYIGRPIGRPLIALSTFLRRAATTGNLTLMPEDISAIQKYSQIPNETGQLIVDASAFIEHVSEMANALELMSSGDLTNEVSLESNEDTMGIALKNLSHSLNEVFSNINDMTYQVTSGSKQIANGAQTLAQGSTEQAASVEELSASISEIATKTRDNAEMAGRAAEFAGDIMKIAEKGSSQMDEMTSAVNDINQASHSIGKVIKVIDDIAFQTNILALNAAVEAARAGQHGKGFAVVAEEVRNLASKSANAAKETGSLITSSIEKAKLGARIVQETAASLEQIVSGINESSQIVEQIALSSEEQSQGIEQINTGIDQVSQVVQQNSATAEQSAAASEEMSGQASLLNEMISRFKLSDRNRALNNPQSIKSLPERK